MLTLASDAGFIPSRSHNTQTDWPSLTTAASITIDEDNLFRLNIPPTANFAAEAVICVSSVYCGQQGNPLEYVIHAAPGIIAITNSMSKLS